MSKKFEELELAVTEWANKRDLLHEHNSSWQLHKTVSELGELADAYITADDAAICDELGDVFVCLIIFASQLGLNPMECLSAAYDKISKRAGTTVNGVFIKDGE